VTRRVLYLVHGMPPEEFTGTPLVAHGYATSVPEHGWDATVVYAHSEVSQWGNQNGRTRASQEPFRRIPVPPTHRVGYADWAIQAASSSWDGAGEDGRLFAGILDDVRPDLLHVVDNVLLPLAWPEMASARGIPVVRTVSCAEDLCALIAPVSACSGPEGYCTAPITPEHCAACVTNQMTGAWGPAIPCGGLTEESVAGAPVAEQCDGDTLATLMLSGRRQRLLRMLERKRSRAEFQFRSVFDRTLFSTSTFRRFFEETLPLDPSRVRVVTMGMDRSGWPDEPAWRDRSHEGPVVFSLAAIFDPAKGQGTVAEAFMRPELLNRHDYRLELLGAGQAEVVDDLLAANSNVSVHGPYRPEELPRLLSRADVGLSTSRFETFHRVTREYLLAGLPVVANPTFGISNLIRDEVNGLLYSYRDPSSLSRAVTRLVDDSALREKLTRGARETDVRSVEEEVRELVAVYEELLAERPIASPEGRDEPKAASTAELTRRIKESVDP
jgi:glycosyltransferase involved in cell wall biosynthesis